MKLSEYLLSRVDRHKKLAERARNRYKIKNAIRHEQAAEKFEAFLKEVKP